VPSGSLSVIHPGEIHSARDLDDRITPANFRMMYVSPALIKEISTRIVGREAHLPFFADPIILNADLARLFLNFHRAVEIAVSLLEQEVLRFLVLAQLIVHYADLPCTLQLLKKERTPVQRVCEYLHDNYAENVTLDRLAQLANLSPYHLNRVFSAEVGVPLHAYQTQIRIDRVKQLLSKGIPINQVAADKRVY